LLKKAYKAKEETLVFPIQTVVQLEDMYCFRYVDMDQKWQLVSFASVIFRTQAVLYVFM